MCVSLRYVLSLGHFGCFINFHRESKRWKRLFSLVNGSGVKVVKLCLHFCRSQVERLHVGAFSYFIFPLSLTFSLCLVFTSGRKSKHTHYLEDGVNLHEFNTNHCQLSTLTATTSPAAASSASLHHANAVAAAVAAAAAAAASVESESCKVNGDFYHSSTAPCLECSNDYYQHSLHQISDEKGQLYPTCDCYSINQGTGSASLATLAGGGQGGVASTGATFALGAGDLHLNATSLSATHQLHSGNSLLTSSTSNIPPRLKQQPHSHHSGSSNSNNSPCASPHSSSCSVHVPLSVVMLILLTYILIGGCIFSHWHPSWSFLDGCFYSFLTLSTISSSSLSPSPANSITSSSGGTAAAAATASTVAFSSSSSRSGGSNIHHNSHSQHQQQQSPHPHLSTASPSSLITPPSINSLSSSPSLSSSLMSSSSSSPPSSTINSIVTSPNSPHPLPPSPGDDFASTASLLLMSGSNSPGKRIAITAIYLLMGFALISMCFNLIYSDVKNYFIYINSHIDSLFHSNSSSSKNNSSKSKSKLRNKNRLRTSDSPIESVAASAASGPLGASSSSSSSSSTAPRNRHSHRSRFRYTQQHQHQQQQQALLSSTSNSNATGGPITASASVTIRDEMDVP